MPVVPVKPAAEKKPEVKAPEPEKPAKKEEKPQSDDADDKKKSDAHVAPSNTKEDKKSEVVKENPPKEKT